MYMIYIYIYIYIYIHILYTYIQYIINYKHVKLVCLKEFDFAARTQGFAALYEEHLGEAFEIHTMQRTGGKQEGLALLLRRDSFDGVDVKQMKLSPTYCDRVALVARMTHRATTQRIIVANTHLTVAHASNGHDIPVCRPEQMAQVLRELGLAGEQDVVLLCADMNCDHLETEPSGVYSAKEVSLPVTRTRKGG